MIVSRKISVQAATALLAAFAAVMLFAAMPSPAAALNWSPATDLSAGPANDAGDAQVAVAVDGATTVVWTRSNGVNNIVQARTRLAGSSRFGDVVNLSAAGDHAYNPQVAVAVDGTTTVVWSRSNDVGSIIWARTRPAGLGSTFRGAVNLSADQQDAYYDPQVAVAANGATTVVWNRSNGVNNIIQARTRPAGSIIFAAVENLSAGGQDAYDPQVAVAAAGATTVVWTRSGGPHNIVQARTRPAGSIIFAAAVNLSAGGQHAYEPQVVVAVDGATTVVWNRSNGSNFIVQARTRPAGSIIFAAVVNLSATGQQAYEPQVVVAVDGATTVVWTRSNGVNSIVQARTRPAGSVTFAAAVNLSATGQSANSPQVAVAANGATTVVWNRHNGSNFIVQARTRPAGSIIFAAVENLSAGGQDAYDPQVAVAAAGAATAVWTLGGPTYTRIQESTTKYSLTLTRSGAGSGSVSSVPAGINCGLVCSYPFGLSTSVTLTATATAGSSFAGWSGSGCSGTSTCTVTMLAARAVTAEFTVVPPGHFNLALSKSVTGGGTVTSSPAGIDCGADCSENLLAGTSVTLTAAPAVGSSFTGWSGSGCSGTSTCTVTMSAARNVNAEFAVVLFDLTVSKSGTGGGTVTSSPAGINCGSDCSESLEDGTSVTLTATPAAGSSFTGWSGSGCAGTSTCTVTMLGARSVGAEFTKLPPNHFTIRSMKVGRKALKSTVVLPGPGTLTQLVKRSSKAVCKTSKKVTKAGTVKLTCKLSAATRKALRKRSLRVSVKTTFVPTGGLTASKTKLIKLLRR